MMAEIEAIRVILVGGSRQDYGEKKAPHSLRPVQVGEEESQESHFLTARGPSEWQIDKGGS